MDSSPKMILGGGKITMSSACFDRCEHRFGMAYALGSKTIYIVTYSTEMTDGIFYSSYIMDERLCSGSFIKSDLLRQPENDLIKLPAFH